ncbi:MAG: thiamine pyrophosphate-dependent enzyme [Chloroflexota bacterium]
MSKASEPTKLHPAFDWHEATRHALASRFMDEMEEKELTPQGVVTYQFSARGHELGQVLIAQLLTRPFDAASVYYRSRPFMFASGLTLEEAFASDMARPGSLSGGRDVGVVFNMPTRGRATVLPMAGDVGSQFTPAAGWAQALRYRVTELGQTDLDGSICVVFGGDGAVASNGFWSALTMATTLQLPLLFVVEDNGYAISVKSPLQTPGANIAANLASWQNLQVWDGDGTKPEETAVLVETAVNHVRSGAGPGLLRLTVPRLSGHSSVDTQAYKSKEELDAEWERDPIVALNRCLVPDVMSKAEWHDLVMQVMQEVSAARHAAQAQPVPDAATVARYVWARPEEPQQVGGLVGEGVHLPTGNSVPHAPEPRRINMIEAIRRIVEWKQTRAASLGEDVGVKGGVHAATLGLQTQFGKRLR